MIISLKVMLVYSLTMLTSSTKIGLIVNQNDGLIVAIVEKALIDYKTIESNNVSLIVMKNNYPCDQQSFDLIFDYSTNNCIKVNNTQTKLVSINDQQISSSCSNDVLIVHSPNFILIRSFETLVNQYHLNNVYIICDSKLELKVDHFKLFNSSVKLIWNQFDTNSENNLIYLFQTLKSSNFTNILVIGEPVSINKLLDIVQRLGLFRQPFTWFTMTKSLNKLKCTSCKHGQMINIEPIQSNLHEYPYKPNLTSLVKPDNSIDTYFYYDLTRLILSSFDWHKQTVQQFGQYNGSMFINDTKVKSFVNSIHSLIQSFDYMGRYGDWIMNNIEMDNQLDGKLRCNVMYQSLSMRLTKKTKLFNKYESKVIGYMDFSQSIGNVYFTSPISESQESFLKIVTILQPPFVMKKFTNSSADNDAYYGFYIDIFNHLKNRYGFKFPIYQITEVPDGLYGVSQKDEDEIKWTGAAQQFASNEADFGLIGMAVTAERESIMDFTEPIFDMVGLSVMMKKPYAQDFTFVFINVLESDVWYSVFISYCVTSIIMSIFDFYNSKRRKLQAKAKDEKRMKTEERKNTVGDHFSKIRKLKDHEDDNDTIEESVHLESEIIIEHEADDTVDSEEKNCTNDRRFNLKESLWFCLVSLTPQGGGEAPSALSGRLVAATWWLFGFILVASYTANFAAFLTVSRLDKNIDTFAQMSRQYKVRYTAIQDTFTDQHFRLLAQNEDRYYEIWKALSLDDTISEYERSQFAVWDYPVSDRFTKIRAQMDEVTIPKSFESALRTVRRSVSPREGYALIGERLSMEWAESLYCDIRVLDSTWAYHPIAFPISFNDPFNLKPFLDQTIKEMKSSGELDKLRVKYWGKSKLNCPEWRNPNGIDVKNIRGCFIILSVGLFLTVLAHTIENAVIAFVAKQTLYPQSRKSHVLTWLIKPTESG